MSHLKRRLLNSFSYAFANFKAMLSESLPPLTVVRFLPNLDFAFGCGGYSMMPLMPLMPLMPSSTLSIVKSWASPLYGNPFIVQEQVSSIVRFFEHFCFKFSKLSQQLDCQEGVDVDCGMSILRIDLHDRTVLKALKAAVVKELKGSSTAYMCESLRRSFPQYAHIIDSIVKIKPYKYDRATGLITEPMIRFDTNDVIIYSYIMMPKANPGSSQKHYVYCQPFHAETQLPPDDVDQLRKFGLDVYRFLIDFDLNH